MLWSELNSELVNRSYVYIYRELTRVSLVSFLVGRSRWLERREPEEKKTRNVITLQLPAISGFGTSCAGGHPDMSSWCLLLDLNLG